MSLVRFKAKNHPQQTDKRGALAVTDDRAITLEDFATPTSSPGSSRRGPSPWAPS